VTGRGLACACAVLAASSLHAAEPVVVGSKPFTESYVLAEIFAQSLELGGFAVERRYGLGSTLISFTALREGQIDVYPEYTGTLSEAILQRPGASPEEISQALADQGISMLPGLGFSNSYALAMPRDLAAELDILRVSDLADHPGLRTAVSHEFLERADGWPGLQRTYGLPQEPEGIAHGLAYRAAAEGRLDLTDAYTTDGDLATWNLLVLEDDLDYFPDYLAVPLVSRDLPPRAREILSGLAGTIDEDRMRALNARAANDGESFSSIARSVVETGRTKAPPEARGKGDAARLGQNLLTHLKLTGVALLFACIAGIALAAAVHDRPRAAQTVLYAAGLLQTIPSIALLALMIPLFGVGALPAIVALFLYSLLPILRSSVTALTTVDPLLNEVGEAMGMTPRQRLKHVLVPLALPHILSGLRIAAVISIGTATLAAFIGAGGLGEPIVTGLALNDTALILQGAVPAALLALVTELLFEGIERALVPPHLRAAVPR
jgi:osmoprotectant transport system permease protein